MSLTAVAPQVENNDRGWKAWAAGGGMSLVLALAAIRLLVLLLASNRYGYFGDELYFLACGQHLDWGYVDQPPLIALAAWLVRHTIGTSLIAIHILPALCGAALIVLTGVIARELGAGRFGMFLAALASMCALIYWPLNHLFTMNAFEPLLWMGGAYLVIRIINTGNQKLWLWFGVLAGIGLENKYSMAIFGFGIVAGLLLTRDRRALTQKWIWIAGAIAFLIFLPNLLWNINHHWPFVELMRNIRASGRDVQVSPLGYLGRQVFFLNPLAFPIWITGLLWFFFGREGRRYRVLAWAYAVSLVVMIAFGGKDYYLAPAYPMLFAGGAIAIERVFAKPRLTWARIAYPIILLVPTALLLPLGIPVLPVQTFLRFQEKLPFKLPADEKAHTKVALPHHFAWNFGWEEMVAAVAKVYNNLPPEERAKTAIIAGNFGEAGAIDLLGAKYGLPKAISGHQNYWLWGPRNYTGEIMIVIGSRAENERKHFDDVQIAATYDNPYGAIWEQRPILLCRQHGRWQLRKIWGEVKSWD